MIYPIVHLYVPCPIGKQQACLFKGAPDKSVEIKKKKKFSDARFIKAVHFSFALFNIHMPGNMSS